MIECTILDPNKFTAILLEEFIRKTPDLVLSTAVGEVGENHLLFLDASYYNDEIYEEFKNHSVIIISSDQKHIRSYFSKQIVDFVNKEDLSYDRFLRSVEKFRFSLKEN